MNLKVMPLKVQNKQSFMGMNFSNPQERARFIAQRQIETVVRAQQSDAFIKSNTSSRTNSIADIINSSSEKVSFKGLEEDDPIKWAQTWNEKERRKHYDSLYEDEIAPKWTKIGNKKIKAKYDAQFNAEQLKVMHILQAVKSVQDKVDTAQSKEDAAKAQARANELTKKELELTERLKNRINSRLNDPNANINQSIAGYMPQKEAIRDTFLAPIDLEKEYIREYNERSNNRDFYTQEEIDEAKRKADNVSIPPSVLFYGCFGTGKTTFARAIAAEAGCYAEEFNPANELYEKFVDRALREARERYIEKGQRTIIIINEIEEYLNNDDNARKNVARMKSTLDYCSNTPTNSGQTGASAATFFFTTNFPKDLLYTGILGRAGKMPLVVPVEPATGDDLKEVLKFHIKRVMPSESSFDVDKYDFTSILDKLDPTREEDPDKAEKMGFYSNDRIRATLDEIRTAYDKNPEKSFKTYLEEMIIGGKSRKLKLRDISPDLYQQYYDDYETIGEG